MERDYGSRAEAHSESLWNCQRTLMCAHTISIPTKPWHGLGQELKGPVSSADAIAAANLGWSVSKRELITLDGIPCGDYVGVVRDDNSKVLSVGQN